MREAGYNRYALHKEDHERRLDEIRDLMEAYEDRTGFDESAFGARLGAWFTVQFRAFPDRGRPTARESAVMRGDLRFQPRTTGKRGQSPIEPSFHHHPRRVRL